VRVYDVLIAVLMVGAAVLIARTESRMTAVIGLGVVGYGMALVFMLHGGPDLAMTQFAVETLSVVLFVLVVYRLPKFTELSRRTTRVRDAAAALSVAAVLCVLVFSALSLPHDSLLAPYFATQSWVQAHGRNVVNVILVDFRAIDTLGEITVLALGAIGVFGLMTLRPAGRSE
jgi:multicomponent Na+:H+ antiporter subunit A